MSTKEKAKKDKKRGLFITFFFHGALLAIALYPFTYLITQENAQTLELVEEVKPEKIYTELTTEFVISNKTETSSSRSSKPQPSPEPVPNPTPAPDPKEVVTDDNIKEEPVPVPPTPNNNENINPVPPVPVPDPNPGWTNNNSNTNGNGNGNNGNGNGNNGNGIWGNDNGDGSKFSRKVLQHPDELKRLTKEQGTIVVRIAVNRDGKVLDTKYMQELSSIQNEKIGKAAAHFAKKYRFERDYKVPEVQYCNITIVFELDK